MLARIVTADALVLKQHAFSSKNNDLIAAVPKIITRCCFTLNTFKFVLKISLRLTLKKTVFFSQNVALFSNILSPTNVLI